VARDGEGSGSGGDRVKMKQRKAVKKRKKGKSISISPIKGIIKAQKCKTCGHHEMGIVTDGGHYIPLKPGMKVKIVKE